MQNNAEQWIGLEISYSNLKDINLKDCIPLGMHRLVELLFRAFLASR
jgi:hypothetical protein